MNVDREFLSRQGFLPVGRESYPVFKPYDSGINQFHELTATVSTIWAFSFDPLYKIIEGFLCSLWFYKTGEAYFYIQRPPAGIAADSGVDRAALRRVIDALRECALGAGLPTLQIWAVDDTLLADLQAALPPGCCLSAECSDDYSEYVYRMADILEWNGGVNLNKRNSLKRCFNTPDVSLGPLTKENFAACFEVEDEWCSHQDCVTCRGFAGCARDSLKNMEEIFDVAVHGGAAGPYGGLLLYVAGKPIGYAIWEVLGSTAAVPCTAYVYFAKANITNFNVYLYYTMAKDYLPGVTFLNNGYDMGKPGLRTFKKHLSVHTMMKKYLCTVETS